MTRSLVAAVAIASLVSGCASSKRSLLIADGAVIVAGAAVRVASDPSHCDTPDLGSALGCFDRAVGGYYAGYALIAVGALLFLGTAAFYNPAEPAVAPPSALVEEPVAPASDVSPVGRLAQEASLEARAGHCYAVQVLANRIDLLDREYRERVLMHDAATAMCLE